MDLKMDYQARLRRYEQEFAWAIEQSFPMSTFTYTGFKELQQALELGDADILPLEQRLISQAETKHQAYQNKLQRYKERFVQAVNRSFPLDDKRRTEFQELQQTLELRPEDVQQLERPILARKELEQQPQPISQTQLQSETTQIQSDRPEPSAAAEPEPEEEDSRMYIRPRSEEEAPEPPQIIVSKQPDRSEPTVANPDQRLSMEELQAHFNPSDSVELQDVADYDSNFADEELSSPSPTSPSHEANGDRYMPDDWDGMPHPEMLTDQDEEPLPHSEEPMWGDETSTVSKPWDDMADTTNHHNGAGLSAGEMLTEPMDGAEPTQLDGYNHGDRNGGTLPTSEFLAETDDDDPRERYTRLESLLEAGLWKEADLETQAVLLKCTGRTRQGWLDQVAIAEFPCVDLRRIDSLWLQYSEGKFGFSVQHQIYANLQRQTAIDFGKQVGWWANGVEFFKYYSVLRFARSAPRGHFPARWFWQIPWREAIQMGSLVRGRGGCSGDKWMMATMMRRIEQCNL
jgi:hypothetical protein